MRVSSILFGVAAVVLAISLVSVWFFPSVQHFMVANTMWNGIRDFMKEFDAVAIDSLDDLPASPENTALVEIPYLQHNDDDLRALKQFVEEGGTLLLMDDFGFGNEVLTYLGLDARFSNKPLLDPLFSYRNQRMPRITDFSPELEDSSVRVAVLNNPTALTGVDESEIIAWSSAASYLDENNDGTLDPNDSKGPLPAAARFRLGKGTVVAVADPSVIVSSMMGRDDNFRFVAYLTGDKALLFDTSHLPATPLDTSKANLLNAREMLSNPYAVVGIMAGIFIVVSRFTLRRTQTVG